MEKNQRSDLLVLYKVTLCFTTRDTSVFPATFPLSDHNRNQEAPELIGNTVKFIDAYTLSKSIKTIYLLRKYWKQDKLQIDHFY